MIEGGMDPLPEGIPNTYEILTDEKQVASQFWCCLLWKTTISPIYKSIYIMK
jgi:hypothetical protein